jgi:hypothetical protein
MKAIMFTSVIIKDVDFSWLCHIFRTLKERICIISKVVPLTLLMSTMFFVYPFFSFGQISRGSSATEIYVKCLWYIDLYGKHYYCLLRSTDNCENLSVQHYFVNESYMNNCLADDYPGVIYNIHDSVLEKSIDYGITWNTYNKPKGVVAATSDLAGELYVTAESQYFPGLFRTSDYGLTWDSVSSIYIPPNSYNLLDVGSTAGEIYEVLVYPPISDTIVLEYSIDYGATFTPIFIDTSLIMNSNLYGVPWLSHGTFQGEFYLLRSGSDGAHMFYTNNNGRTFEYRSTLPWCYTCNYPNTTSYSAGRTPGSFFYEMASQYDTLGYIITNLCIDVSLDYGQTFSTYCYFLDSTFTLVNNLVPPSNSIQLSCHPNPFYYNTEINYSLIKAGYIDLCIYDSQGALVTSLVHSKKAEGPYSINWDGKDQHGNLLAPGIYILIMNVDGIQSKTEKVVILK